MQMRIRLSARPRLCVELLLCLCALRVERAAAAPYGVCSHLAWGEFAGRDKTFALCRVAGIDTIRCDFPWDGLEKPKGMWNFSRTDAIVADAKAAGVAILPILDYDHPDHPKPYLDAEPWSEYVWRVANRYAADCPVFEVWNEPDHPSRKDTTNPTNYFAILKSASDAIRAAAPGRRVALAGLCGVPVPYIEELYRLGAGQCFDIMNIHAYSVPDAPEGRLDQMLEKLRSVMAKYGDEGKPVWITEIGWPTNGQAPEDDPRRTKWAYGPGVDEALAAVYLSRELGIAFAEDVGMFMPYELRDREFDRYGREAHFGLCRNNFTPKPALAAYAAFTAMRPAGSMQKSDRMWRDGDFFFPQWRRPDNADALREGNPLGADAGMLWTTGGTETRMLRFSTGLVRFFDHLGAEVWPERRDGGWAVEITDKPLFFVGGELCRLEGNSR